MDGGDCEDRQQQKQMRDLSTLSRDETRDSGREPNRRRCTSLPEKSKYEIQGSFTPFRMTIAIGIGRNGYVHLLLAAAVGAGGGMVAGDVAVADGDDAVGILGDIGLVGNDDDGVAVGVEVVEESHDLVAGFGVEVSGGLVGEDDGRAVDEGASDGDALALATGELI